MGGDGYSGADAGSIGLCANGADLDPIAGWSCVGAGVAAEKLRKAVDAIDDYVEVAIVVVVSEGGSAGGCRGGDAGTGLRGDLFELAVAEIAIEVLVLRVGGVDAGAFNLGVDVAVGHEDVEPPVIVHVEEAYTPAEEAGVDAEAGEIGVVVEVAVAEVEVEGVGVASKIGFDDVEETVAVEVADGDAHACLGFAVGGVGDAGLDGDIFERAVFLVLIERCGGRVVGDVDVGPAIIVEVGYRNR